jgi:pilus assembly protein CpaE
MQELSAVILSGNDDQRAILVVQVNGTAVAKVVGDFADYPVGSKDPTLKRIHDLKPAVVLVDIPEHHASAAVSCVELLHSQLSGPAVFAIGDMSRPQQIVEVMRSGAQEYLAAPTSTSNLLDAFVRLSSKKRKVDATGRRGKLITVMNAKGGSGATTIAVNTALSLQRLGSTVLFDLAPLSHASLQLNLRAPFTVQDAVQNLHRMDQSLLEGFMVRHSSGLNLLSGTVELATATERADLAKVCDLLVSQYSFVVIDVSTRLDWVAQLAADVADDVLLVAQADVASLWSASRVQAFVGSSGSRSKMRLVLNRYRKIAGFTDADVEGSTQVSIIAKVPNNFVAVASGIDRGVPVAQQGHSEMARAFSILASILTEQPPARKAEARWFGALSLARSE